MDNRDVTIHYDDHGNVISTDPTYSRAVLISPNKPKHSIKVSRNYLERLEQRGYPFHSIVVKNGKPHIPFSTILACRYRVLRKRFFLFRKKYKNVSEWGDRFLIRTPVGQAFVAVSSSLLSFYLLFVFFLNEPFSLEDHKGLIASVFIPFFSAVFAIGLGFLAVNAAEKRASDSRKNEIAPCLLLQIDCGVLENKPEDIPMILGIGKRKKNSLYASMVLENIGNGIARMCCFVVVNDKGSYHFQPQIESIKSGCSFRFCAMIEDPSFRSYRVFCIQYDIDDNMIISEHKFSVSKINSACNVSFNGILSEKTIMYQDIKYSWENFGR